jgi:putative ABC transport system permease protein
MKNMGWNHPEEAIGKNIGWSNSWYQLQKGPIVGVVRDFHQESLKNKVDPVVLVFEPLWLRTFLVKLSTGQISHNLSEIEETWNQMFPQYPFEYVFVDELYEKLYKSESQQLQLLYALSGLAIFIAFLGLSGLVAYTLKTRTKEIAVRKIFGANYIRLVGLLSKEYLSILIAAAIIAIPVSYYFVTWWLKNFAYRTKISWDYYLLTLLLIMIILISTITFHTYKSTRINPVESLREN